MITEITVRDATEAEYAAFQFRQVERGSVDPVDTERLMLVPSCVVGREGYVPFTRAIYWMVPKSISNSVASIRIQEWEDARYKLLSLIGSRKVTLTGRHHGVGVNKPLPPELLANIRVVDWMYDPLEKPLLWRRHPNASLPDAAFFQCCYCPDDEMWQDGTCDQYFSSIHLSPEWTHLQVDMAEVVAVLANGGTTAPPAVEDVPALPVKDGPATQVKPSAEAANGERVEPQALLTTPEAGAPSEIKVSCSSNKSKFQCEDWLYQKMICSPLQRTMTQGEAYEMALKLWSDLSKRSFLSAWASAVQKSGSKWSKGGRPPKSPHS